jgi:hypothetical protein
MRLLLIEDNQRLADYLATALQTGGFAADHVATSLCLIYLPSGCPPPQGTNHAKLAAHLHILLPDEPAGFGRRNPN